MGLLQENSSPNKTIYDRTINEVRFVIEPGFYELLSLWYRGIIVTARSVEDYEGLLAIPKKVLQVIGGDQKTIYEVGAGMSLLTPTIAENTNHICVNIDPLPYHSVLELLIDARKFSKLSNTQFAIKSLINIARIYSNPKKVRHSQMTIEDLYSLQYAKHCKNADVVIDVNAADMYSPDRSMVELMEKDWLLSSRFTNFVWSPGAFHRRTSIND